MDEQGSGLGRYYESMQASQPEADAAAPPHVSRVDWSKFEGHSRRLARPSNTYAMVTFVLIVIYLAIAAATGFALLGIAPLLMSFRSYQNEEPLALFAALAAVGSMVLGFVLWPL